jgi:hypothetical protein
MSITDPNRTGLLIVRLWIETAEEGFRARITQTLDSSKTNQAMSMASSPDEVYAVVQRWVQGFVNPN